MSFYPTIPQEDELDFSSSSAPSAPSNVFQYAQEQLGGSNEKSSIYPTQDISYPLPNLGSGNQGNLGGSSNYGGSGDFGNFPINSGSIDQYSQVSAPQVNNLYNNNANPNFSSYSSYSAPPIPNQSEGELEYAPPMHTIQPTQPKLPPQWVPSCIPNPQRVNYESACKYFNNLIMIATNINREYLIELCTI